jgi:hypothetical protein
MDVHLGTDREVLQSLPRDRPFLTSEARDLGVRDHELGHLVRVGCLRRPFRGVYVAEALADSPALRLAVLRLVVPPDCVVTDRTAGWLWVGDRVLAPNDHLQTSPISVFSRRPGYRLRAGLCASGERQLSPRDIVELSGLAVTTPLRTACDLGRLLYRDQALAALDALAGMEGFSLDALAFEEQRFKGYRGVCQLRWLIPIVDARSESSGESVLRLRWYDAGLPRPECQIEVPTPWGASYRIDLGLPDVRFGAEYDGDEFHGPEDREHDRGRRAWLWQEGQWILVVARRNNVHGQHQDIHGQLMEGWLRAQARKQ